MAVPDYQTLMLPLLRQAGQGIFRVPEVMETIADDFHLSQEDRDCLMSNGRTNLLLNRLHWAKTYLSKAGLIVSPSRGAFTISDAGRALLDQNPKTISKQTLRDYPSFLSFIDGSRRGADSCKDKAQTPKRPIVEASRTPEEMIEAARQELSSSLNADLLECILAQ